MIPSEEFMALRDEILIQILGIDGSEPIYNSYWRGEIGDGEVELPYGGVLAKLGQYAYSVPLHCYEFGFDFIPTASARLFYPDKGLELDVVYSGDRPYNIIRYLYITNSSAVELPSGIGIGSAREDVIAAYEQYIIPDFRPMLTLEEVVALGSDLNGIYFVIREDCVHSIYVGTVREDSKYISVFESHLSWNYYPKWFYPDREYMEATQPTDIRYLQIPNENFQMLRDEMLLQILGINGNKPLYQYEVGELGIVPEDHVGVFAKLGEYAYSESLSDLDLGFAYEGDSAYRYYYPDVGLEIDVLYQDDQLPVVLRYLYIANNSEVKLPGGIGIGSTREEVVAEYEPYIFRNFQPMLTSEEVIALGSDLNGVYFIIRDDCVYSIYIGTVREVCIYSNVFETNAGWNYYPAWFYPDREYMESVQSSNP